MDQMIKKMRADFELVGKARCEAGEWTAEDFAEFGRAIKTAIDSRNIDSMALWARWLADLSAGVVFFNMVIRGAEAGMRAKTAEMRAAGK